MKLKGIETQGFKSFPDKIKLNFEHGITAVVGPNGSGKSNISDAVRWVFGEQSSKTLRGSKMEDVIFSGTQSRKPQGIAWVSLIIDNTDRTLDIDNDEVVVTRRLYRSGESEYRINKNQVRLRDIVELFLDTGLGRDGYSIIGQGRIAEIVGAKSTQRREIFEEAAGIAKFRMRKTDAERRLNAAEENLVRLRDILGELEGRVEPLRVQSEKASQFLLYAQEKKVLDISLWMEKLDKLQTQAKTHEDKLLICRNDRDATGMELDNIAQQIEKTQGQRQEMAIYIDNHRQTIRSLEESISRADTEIAVMENDILHTNENVQRMEQELKTADLAHSEHEQRLEQNKSQLEQKQSEREEKRLGMLAISTAIEDKKSNLNRLASEVESLKAQRFTLREGLDSARQTAASSLGLIEDTQSRIEGLRQSSEQKDENLARIEGELLQCEGFVQELRDTIEGLQNSQKGYELKVGSQQDKLQRLLAEQHALDQKAGELLSRAQLLSDMEKQMEGFGASVKFIMKQSSDGGLSGVVGPVSGLISTDDRHSTAIEIALGAAMQNIVVENENVAKQAISRLKQAKAGRCTFLPVSTIKGNRIQEKSLESKAGFVGVAADLVRADQRFSGIITSLLGRIVVAENIDFAVEISKAFSARFRVVTLDGQVVNAGGSLTGGYVTKSAGILGRRSEIERLRTQAAEIGQQSKAMEGDVTKLSGELSGQRAALDGIAAELKTAGEDLVGAQAEHRRLTMTRDEAADTHTRAKNDYRDLCARLEELKAKSSSSEEAADAITDQLSHIEEELSAKGEKRQELLDGTEQDGESFATIRMEFMSAEKDLEQIRSAIELLENQRDGHSRHLEEIRQQIQQLLDRVETVRGDIEERRSRTETERERVAELSGDIEQKSAQSLALEQSVTEARKREREVMHSQQQISAELARLEERHAGVMNDFDSIISKLWEEYELSRTQAQELAIPLEDVQVAQRRSNELRGKIKGLGSVNLGAIEEYKEVAERYEFMRTQVEDVEHSKRELGKIITELTGEMCSIFSDKFTAINTEFSRIFVELFGGGRGHLELSDPTDVLESGIDIYVQPPGKLIKNLSALSGGEQAFVAIAIYFAILKVSPAPFCLIDEIEAALDDVNVTKFATYLRHMTDKTQFIAITHRRGTMEEADVLYGVTMQEEGVSKVLRLNVSEIEQKLGMK